MQPRFEFDEPRGLEPLSRELGAGVVLATGEVLAHIAKCRLDRNDVALATALCGELCAGAHHGSEVSEQRVVVQHPVERGRRQHRVDRIVDRQRLLQVGDHVTHAIVAEPIKRSLDHRGGTVERHDLAPWKPRPQLLGDLTGSASGVEHAFVASEVQPAQHGLAPPSHWDG